MTIRNYATAEGVNFFYSATCGWVAGSTTRNTNSETTAEVVKKSLLAMGEQVTQKAEGDWVLDGVLIKNPSDELGEEFEDICTFVCTKAATTQFVSAFSEAEVDAMMTAEIEAVNAKAVKDAAESVARQLGHSIRVVLSDTLLEVWGGPDGFTKLSNWSTTGLFGKPLLVGLDSAALRNEVVAALKPAISDIIKKGECGVHSL